MATLNKNLNFLRTLVDQGNDAHSNIYLANFSIKNANETVANLGTIRCEGFNPPSTSQDSYTIKFLNIHIDRPRAKVSVDKFFDLTFRVDGNYQMYKMLKELQSQNFNENSDKNLSKINIDDIIDQELSVSVSVPDNDSTTSDLILFKCTGCWIESVTPISYKQGTSEPIKVTARVNYLYLDDLQTDMTTKKGS